MAFARVKPEGWGFTKKLASSLLNQLDINVSNALDGLNGGIYNLAAALKLRGQDVEVDQLVVPHAKTQRIHGTLSIESDGALDANGPATFDDVVTFNNAVSCEYPPGFNIATSWLYYMTLPLGSAFLGSVWNKILNGTGTQINPFLSGNCTTATSIRCLVEVPTPPPGANTMLSIDIVTSLYGVGTPVIFSAAKAKLIELAEDGSIANSWMWTDPRGTVAGNYVDNVVANNNFVLNGTTGVTLSPGKRYLIEVWVTETTSGTFNYHVHRLTCRFRRGSL